MWPSVMLYYMINKNAQIVFNGVSDTGNISMQDILPVLHLQQQFLAFLSFVRIVRL